MIQLFHKKKRLFRTHLSMMGALMLVISALMSFALPLDIWWDTSELSVYLGITLLLLSICP